MTKQESYIEFILSQLQNGNVDAEKICAVFRSNFQKSARTFYNYWEEAQERHKQAQILINKEKDELYRQKEVEVKKMQLLSRDERLKIADDIAKGNARKIKIGEKSELLIPTAGDQLKALDYLAKVHGDYASLKHDVSIGGVKIVIKKKWD